MFQSEGGVNPEPLSRVFEHEIIKKLHDFPKTRGGQSLFETFPKILPFWCGHAADNDNDDDDEEIADSKADGALTLKRTQAGKPELSNAISCLAVRRRWRLSKMMMIMGIVVMMMNRS